MSTDTKPRAGWRPLERIGYGIGCVGGSVALLLLWTFAITSAMRGAARPKGSPGGA